MTELASGFVPFLGQDNVELSSSNTQQVLEAINNDLSQLLRLPPQQFWHVVVSDQSLHRCLDSFLRFRRRCYDESPESIQGSSDVLLQLSQRVFRVFWRMVHPQEQQQAASKASASAAAAAGKSQPPAPGPQQVADLLYNQWLMDVPKMMDLAVLYAPGSTQLTQQLLQQLLVLQPKYAQDIFNLSGPLTANLHQLLESVKQLANKVLAPTAASASGAAETLSKQLLPELAEAVSYFMDAFLTLQALVECLPEAAALLLNPQHHGELLIVLATVHSSTLPLIRRVAQQPAAAAVPGLSAARIQQVQQCLQSLVFHLLRSAFCTRAGAHASKGPAAIQAAAAASSSNSKKNPPPGFNNSSNSRKDSGSAQEAGFDPEVQGQELMHLLMLLAHPADAVAQAQGPAADAKANMLAAVNHTYHLDAAVSAAVSEGLLGLDDAQFDYFLALVDGDRHLLQQRQTQHQQQRYSQPAASTVSSSTQAGTAAAAAAGAAAGSSSVGTPPPADLAAKVSSIKELLPDYGDGFLAAVLFHTGYSTEQAINCLLEGSLPKAVQGLDPSLKTWKPPAISSSREASGQAAGTSSSSGGSSGLSWTGLAREAAATAAAAPRREPVQLPSLAAAAAAGPKPGIDRRTNRVLGAVSGKVRNLTKNIAQEMQFEYDDEYDDSFDDLVGPGNDGVCDIEGEDTGAATAAGSSRRGVAAAADEYADEPGSSVGMAGVRLSPQQQQQRGRPQRKEKLWVLDGKVYNYKKEGAQEVEGQVGAQAALKVAKAAALEIHGLGPGGNVPLPLAEDNARQKSAGRGAGAAGSSSGGPGPAAAAGAGAGGRGQHAAAGRGGPNPHGGGHGGGRSQHAEGHDDGNAEAGGGRGRGRGRGSFAHKEQHKAAVANHHRRDRALQKQSRGMF